MVEPLSSISVEMVPYCVVLGFSAVVIDACDAEEPNELDEPCLGKECEREKSLVLVYWMDRDSGWNCGDVISVVSSSLITPQHARSGITNTANTQITKNDPKTINITNIER